MALSLSPSGVARADAGPDGADVEADVVPVEVAHVVATSNDLDNPASQVIDGRAGRGYRAAEGVREGARLVFTFKTVHWFSHLDILPGDGRDNVLFNDSTRPGVIEVSWGGRSERFELKDARRVQRLQFATLVVTDEITVTLLDPRGPAKGAVQVAEVTFFEPRDVFNVNPALRGDIDRAMSELDDPATRPAAAAALARFGRHATPFLLRRVTTRGAEGRREALALVLAGDHDGGIKILARLLHSDQVDDLLLALEVVNAGAMPELRGDLVQLLGDARATIRRQALTALSLLPQDAAAWRGLLERALADANGTVRLEAVRMVAEIGDAWAEERLFAQLSRGSLAETQEAARALLASARPPFRALGKLVRATSDDRAAVLVATLGECKRPEATALLADLLVGDASYALLRPLVLAFDEHGAAGLEVLMRRLDEVDVVPATAREFVLERATRPGVGAIAGDALARAAERPDGDDRLCFLLDVVGLAHTAGYRDFARTTFDDAARSDNVRRCALQALGRLGRNGATDALVLDLLNGRKPQFLTTAYQAAIDLRLEEAAALVRHRLGLVTQKRWEPVAVRAYAELGGAEAMTFLRDEYDHTNRLAQAVILDAASRSQTRDGLELLVSALAGPDHMLRGVARRYLTEGAHP
ncbi:MAG: hypothetical protein KC635_13380 [Myxococcales bacterium]|nr:hypothetical protein [Myxococcales bacterium]MCB9736939.1 hypothetical protein [Deltaproteobacteria bacterium]